MKFTGDAVLHAPVDQVWSALLDPSVLVRTIPGCERLEATGENAYAMTVTAGVAAIKGTYAGECAMTDLRVGESLQMKLQGSGAPGTIGAQVGVAFVAGDDGTTTVRYDADAVVGGMIGGVGQRMLTSVSRRMAGEFFGNVDRVLTGADAGPATPVETSTSAEGAPVFTAPARTSGARVGVGSQDDFMKGIAVGAGLVLLGVIAGSVFGRRR
ncbi:carbon monoxide dehydrogenase subunit G [Nocardioides sp.]|uniref:SRPBCC family protein n=1 Tax=Nocardioides sp. TaxID=35761 RepID=UPI00356B0FAB